MSLQSKQFQSWCELTELIDDSSSDDSSDDDDEGDLDEVPNTIGFMRHQGMRMYGECPVYNDFTVVTCKICEMILKPEALGRHMYQRHSQEKQIEVPCSRKRKLDHDEETEIESPKKTKTNDDEQEDFPKESYQTSFDEETEIESPKKTKAKDDEQEEFLKESYQTSFDEETEIESPKNTKTKDDEQEEFLKESYQTSLLLKTQQFFHNSQQKHQSDYQRVTMKLRKSAGTWTVVTC